MKASWADRSAAPAVQDLVLARAPRRPFTLVMPTGEAKRFATVAAAAALAGYELVRFEDDDGCEAFLATRDASTLHFRSIAEADAWVDLQIALRAFQAGH
jgi:hypothetical protein